MATKVKTIKLQTKDGGAIADFECATVFYMKPCPEIIVWGERFFICSEKSEFEIVYREGLLFALIEGVTAKVIK